MSHFVVTVCLRDEDVQAKGLEQALTDVLHPFDENERVPYYRHYEDGGPEEYWWVSAMRQDREEMLKGEGIRPYDPNGPSWSNHGPSTVPEHTQREAQAKRAAFADRLGEHPTWELVCQLYNECYHPDTQLAIPGEVEDDEVDTERLHYDEETGRAYTWTTYNPESKWDWWVIGGRWQRRFVGQPGIQPQDLVLGRPGSFGDNGERVRDNEGRWYCDGGQLQLLDLEATRQAGVDKALERYDAWYAIVDKHGAPPIWANLVGQVEAGELDIDEARRRYNTHPAIEAARDEKIGGFMSSPEEDFGYSREDFIEMERANALVGYAMITLTGEWTAPGHMGWFGMSSESKGEMNAFKVAANKYIDALPSDAWIVNLDCHI